SLCLGLRASLKSQSGELIYYNYPLTFIQSENAKQQIRHSAKIDKRQQPKIKISPKQYLLVNKGLTKSLIIKIPLQYWSLKKGETYTVSLNYKSMEAIKEPKGSVQVNYLAVEIGSFTY
ncbi:MAG: hypothetical protein O9262_06200, partial [Cyclobacteriaceae bacterium]|nr:hypothetical protein [Cyclobacteriaceae bacterium]